jgi:hypothetical protein
MTMGEDSAMTMGEDSAMTMEVRTVDAGAYDIVEGWLQPFQAEGFAFGGNSSVWVESPDRIFIMQRGETPLPDPVPESFAGYAGSIDMNVLRGPRTWQNVIFTVNRDGQVQEIWDQWDHLFVGSEGPGPHRLRISPYDPERRVWVVHETFHQIYVFSNDGSELLHTFGEKGVAASDETHFNLPQDIAFLPDGRVLIADGLGNRRVVVLDADWNYESEFGREGDGLGEFGSLHSIGVGPDGRLIVTDRDDRAVHVFRQHEPDPSRAYHAEFVPEHRWEGFALTLDVLVNEDAIWITEVSPPRVIKLSFEGDRLHEWALPTEGPASYIEMHTFAVGPDGVLYGGDNQHARTQKFVPKADADPSQLIGPRYVPR